MALERVHHPDYKEHFGPVRLGPQDLRDVAAVFAELETKVPPTLPALRTRFVIEEHETNEVEDVLAFSNADTLPRLHVLSGMMHLSFHAGRDGTIIDRSHAVSDEAERQSIDEAAEKLRRIIRAREVAPLETLRQRGPSGGLLLALLAVPAVALAAGQPVLDLWLTRATSQALAAGLSWLGVGPLLFLAAARPRDLIRLRGQELPWWERRQGLIALVSVVLVVVIPLVLYGLDRA